MLAFFFISGHLIRRYIDSVPWTVRVEKRIWSVAWVLVLWGVVQWPALVVLNSWLAPQHNLSHATNAAYTGSIIGSTYGMLTASTSSWYLYVLVVYLVLCKVFSRQTASLLALSVVPSMAINLVLAPWWRTNGVIRNLLRYSLGAWFDVTLMIWIEEVPLRRHVVIVLVSATTAVIARLANVLLLFSLFSAVLIMKLFYQFELHLGMRESGPLSVIGVNTIVIYTIHCTLVELFSLTLTFRINYTTQPAYAEPALLLVYPFACLLLCTLFGLLVHKISQKTVIDLLFSPPSLSVVPR